MIRLIPGQTILGEAELTTYLRAHRWFLNRARDGGIPLTSAGYLKPADVVTTSEIVPAMGGTTNPTGAPKGLKRGESPEPRSNQALTPRPVNEWRN